LDAALGGDPDRAGVHVRALLGVWLSGGDNNVFVQVAWWY